MKTISEFKNEYAFLSNSYTCAINVGGKVYPSAEHAFQALKTTFENEKDQIRFAPNAKEAKKLGQKVTLRANWDNDRTYYMLLVCNEKFKQNPDLLQKLLDTGDSELVEGNYWGDNFWGVFRGKGENNLGKVLMEVRAKFKNPMPPISVAPISVKKYESQLFGLYYDGEFVNSYRTLNFANGARTQMHKSKRSYKNDINKFEIIPYKFNAK